MKSLFFEDYAIGAQRVSTGRMVTEADNVLHSGQKGDFDPHHRDAARCATQNCKLPIAHGTLIFSVPVERVESIYQRGETVLAVEHLLLVQRRGPDGMGWIRESQKKGERGSVWRELYEDSIKTRLLWLCLPVF